MLQCNNNFHKHYNVTQSLEYIHSQVLQYFKNYNNSLEFSLTKFPIEQLQYLLIVQYSCNNLFIKNPFFPSSWMSPLYNYVMMLLVHKDAIGTITCLLSTYLLMIDLGYWVIRYVQVPHACLSQHIFHIACFTYLDTSRSFYQQMRSLIFFGTMYMADP